MLLIGITGKARSGKDTFAKFLADELKREYGTGSILMAYATELKKRVQKDFDLSWEQLWGDEKEEADFRYPRNRNNWIAGRRDTDEIKESYWTPREILQEYGQFFRTIDYDFWVKALFRVIDEAGYDRAVNIIITDVRHPNEADPIREKGGRIIKVIRENYDGIVHNKEHISETAMDDYECDYTIVNDSNLKALEGTAKEVVKLMKFENKLLGGKNG